MNQARVCIRLLGLINFSLEISRACSYFTFGASLGPQIVKEAYSRQLRCKCIRNE
jgi:hypothetical protein